MPNSFQNFIFDLVGVVHRAEGISFDAALASTLRSKSTKPVPTGNSVSFNTLQEVDSVESFLSYLTLTNFCYMDDFLVFLPA